MEQDIRWKQRFANFEKAFLVFKSAVAIQAPNDLEKEGTVQRFEFTHELAWKVMKDYLEYEGYKNIVGSRTATKEAFNKNLLSDGQEWMNMIESRNETVHTYRKEILETEYRKITVIYFPLMEAFYNKMKSL
jgi:nucleotidyltransferase substrate binding protein (TIGR01987 family)